MNKLREYLATLFGIFFISSIGIIILSVTIPTIVLEPISWLIQTGLEYDSYSSSYKPGQSATYFDYYMGPIDGVYYEISIFWLLVLGSLLFLPTLMIVGNVFHYHNSAKKIQKASNKGYISALLEKHRKAKIKPAFWMYFLPSVLLIGAIHYDKDKNIVDVLKFDFSKALTSEKFYKPLSITKHHQYGNIIWQGFLTERGANQYVKEGKNFERLSAQKLTIYAETPEGKRVYEETDITHSFSDTYVLSKNELILTSKDNLIRIDTNTLSKEIIHFDALAKKKEPSFSNVAEVTRTASPYKYKLTDQFGSQIEVSIGNEDVTKSPYNKRTNSEQIRGKHHRVRQLYTYKNSKKLTSEPIIDPDIVYTTNSNIIVTHKTRINQSDHDQLSLFNSQLKRLWKADISKHYHYVDRMNHLECTDLQISSTQDLLIVNYKGAFSACATDIFDIKSGNKVATYIAGNRV
ncbi:hypothetical protein HF888_07130 [Bermanella marisrubri]|uniref:Uncharacterized protein n=1 Tax=Bermanella marisrubri TaxID=207949 RepID=Q1N531_9GAMM|nr:hypothetical protein [Bermanella marisrubri]EAT13247.1 hypothetical protein RED65_00765 [Oceanobacter sp. RED65] [Bermanella marisrubri]QIZ84015.1 hypothetical protein HF888_07130 [Bermanella marisrubri]